MEPKGIQQDIGFFCLRVSRFRGVQGLYPPAQLTKSQRREIVPRFSESLGFRLRLRPGRKTKMMFRVSDEWINNSGPHRDVMHPAKCCGAGHGELPYTPVPARILPAFLLLAKRSKTPATWWPIIVPHCRP